jgi:large repetitive protein
MISPASASLVRPQSASQATNDAYSTCEDAPLDISAALGLLKNDTHAASQVLTAILVAPLLHGAISLHGDGSFSCVPAPDYAGVCSIT